jgi:hypothetical protein
MYTYVVNVSKEYDTFEKNIMHHTYIRRYMYIPSNIIQVPILHMCIIYLMMMMFTYTNCKRGV